ncbi:hypothetical protein Fcan01_02356 [Folsomia candida]|uniref:Uncharacterized protein n=2 Tax=Folsomia candida TaxID=158441 RepID=A0A226EVL9_FOLCA|nr:hypothetical protein Fcan01_02356 [Folsomia candida]
MDKVSPKRGDLPLVRSTPHSSDNVKLPTFHGVALQNSITQQPDHLIPGRRSFMLSPHVRMTHVQPNKMLKLPKLQAASSSAQEEKSKTSTQSTRNGSCERTCTLPPLKLTKHEQLRKETASSSTLNKKVNRFNIDIDKKLSSVHQSMQKFEKKYRSVNDSIKNAVRRSLSDAMKNKRTATTFKPTTSDNYQHKYPTTSAFIGLRRTETTEAKGRTDETVTFSDSITQNLGKEDFRQPNSTTIMGSKDDCVKSCTGDSDHFTSFVAFQRSERADGATQPEKLYDGDKSPRSWSPIMENLSDKA